MGERHALMLANFCGISWIPCLCLGTVRTAWPFTTRYRTSDKETRMGPLDLVRMYSCNKLEKDHMRCRKRLEYFNHLEAGSEPQELELRSLGVPCAVLSKTYPTFVQMSCLPSSRPALQIHGPRWMASAQMFPRSTWCGAGGTVPQKNWRWPVARDKRGWLHGTRASCLLLVHSNTLLCSFPKLDTSCTTSSTSVTFDNPPLLARRELLSALYSPSRPSRSIVLPAALSPQSFVTTPALWTVTHLFISRSWRQSFSPPRSHGGNRCDRHALRFI